MLYFYRGSTRKSLSLLYYNQQVNQP